MGKSKSLAQQIADLDDPLPKEFDPEDGPGQKSEEESGSSDSDDELAGTEHYAAVGKSKLRHPEEVPLGPQYTGSRISRQAVFDEDDQDEGDESQSSESSYKDAEEHVQDEQTFADPDDFDKNLGQEDGDIDSDAAFGESDIEKFKDFTFRGSSRPRVANEASTRPTAADFMSDSEDDGIGLKGDGSQDAETDEDVLDVDEQHREESEDSSQDSGSDQDGLDQSDEDPSAVENSDRDDSSENGSEDEAEEKVRRAELRKIMNEEQKTVVATISKAAKADADKGNAVMQQRKAFDSLLSVRIALQKGLAAANSMATFEDKAAEDSADQAYQAAEDAAIKLWNSLDGLRQELIKAGSSTKISRKRKHGADISTPSSTIWERMQASEIASIDDRQTTLEKWANKVKDTTALPLSRKLNTSQQQSKVASLQDQVARKVQETGRPSSYDDTKLYKSLLNNFVDQRRMVSDTTVRGQQGGPAQFTVVKEAKMRKTVDTKASKGRKMRFTVEEKLQNFMAPEDRGSWEPEAIDRFFGTLLGQKMTLGEEMDVDEEDELPLEEQGLMLFRS